MALIEQEVEKREQILAYYPELEINPESIKIVMINEIVADQPENDFYSMSQEKSPYIEAAQHLFSQAGIQIESIEDLLKMGIYVTSAIKLPKTETTINNEQIKQSCPILESELELFPSVQAIMLNGDVPKKVFNNITKKQTGKNAVPATSTYKLRNSEVFYGQVRIFPAYIMTGKNILIEKSKVVMTAEDIQKMLAFVQ